MKVFISWSGDQSLAVAQVLRDWLPSAFQFVEPYVSSEDIDKGARWSTDIAKELEDSSYGILCVTSDNVDSPWLNFEAGALSKTIDRSKVSPFLFEVRRAEIRGPVLQFQSTIFEEQDVRKLVKSLNVAAGEAALDEARLDSIFDVWWPRLEANLTDLKGQNASPRRPESASISESEILEEILELLRGQQRTLALVQVSELAPRRVQSLGRAWRSICGDIAGIENAEQRAEITRGVLRFVLRAKGTALSPVFLNTETALGLPAVELVEHLG